MPHSKRWHQKNDLVAKMLEYGEWEPIDSWGNGALSLTDERQWEFAEHILGLLEEAWDSGRTTGRYDGLYSDPEYWDNDDNPYREDEDGE